MDSGASHSFLDEGLADELGLNHRDGGKMVAVLADGRRVECGRTLEKVKLHVGAFTFTLRFRTCVLGEYDGLLRRDWLGRHNPAIDWSKPEAVVRLGTDGYVLPL